MSKEAVVCIFNGVPVGHKKELKYGYDTRNNMDEPWKFYSEWKKPDTEVHIRMGPSIWNARAGKSRDRK